MINELCVNGELYDMKVRVLRLWDSTYFKTN